jgi:hypothetical protein
MTENAFRIDIDLRPDRMMTSATEPGQATITGLYINGTNELLMPVDAYEWSAALQSEQTKRFLEEYGLTGKTWQEIDDYCEEHELSMPRIGHVYLPTMKKRNDHKITGVFNIDMVISFIGTSIVAP